MLWKANIKEMEVKSEESRGYSQKEKMNMSFRTMDYKAIIYGLKKCRIVVSIILKSFHYLESI
jgi:ribonuclease HI